MSRLDYNVKKISGITSAIIILSGVGIALFLSPWFDWQVNHLSDLGVTTKNSALFFNSSLILGGLASLIFTIGLFKNSNHIANRIGSAVLGCSAIFLIMVGILNLPNPFHFGAAMMFFTLLPISFFLIGIGLLFEHKKNYGVGTLIAACLVLFFDIIMMSGIFEGFAIPETGIMVTTTSWFFLFGIKL